MNIFDLLESIPPRYRESEIDKSIKLNFSKSWYLSGNPGTGKTNFSYALKIFSIDLVLDSKGGIPIASVKNWAELTGRLRSDIDNRKELIQSLSDIKNLVLDDIGSESRTDFSDDMLFQILNHRYDFMLLTGFTSNFRIGELPYESRIISRIVGIVGNNKYHLKGKDRRVAVESKV